jgi:hypothetical protein
MKMIRNIFTIFYAFLSLSVFSQQHQENTDEFIAQSINQVSTNNCSMIFTITENHKIFFLKEEIKEGQVYDLIHALYEDCKSNSKVHINYYFNAYNGHFDEFHSLIRKPISDLQEELSIELYGKTFSELTRTEWISVEKTYPYDFTAQSCCSRGE